MDEVHHISLTVNGRTHECSVGSRKLLVDLLRDDLQLTGTHIGCGYGVCGACTIIVDGDATRSCLMFAVQAHGASVTTIEGLGTNESPHLLQRAFSANFGLQCGFCTPGLLLALACEFDELSFSSQDAIEILAGHLCRCTGYTSIIDSMESAIAARDSEGGA
ncbi:MAG: 2Fe-2S iron-sulfur cluster-binding protein [Bacteroidota bacterium]